MKRPERMTLRKLTTVFVRRLIFLILTSASVEAAFGRSNSGGSYPRPGLFPVKPDGHVMKQVKFWEKIFYHYPSSAVLIHDSDVPENIIDIIDFRLYAKNLQLNTLPDRARRDKVTQAYLKRYRLAIKRFQKYGKRALKFGAIEARVFDIYRKNSKSLSILFSGAITIRSQAGLADEFIQAAYRAQTYLKFMETTFKNEKVPQEITRLAFVESMFNPDARSKVGASGMWQFMPATAKRYLTINRLVDERNSPYKATLAAAKLLKDNFSKLKSWPLAITAYNHGASGMGRAIKMSGSRDFESIVRRYQSPSFQFASKNFYAEFIAAYKVYERLKNHDTIKLIPAPRQLNTIKLTKEISMRQLLKKLPFGKRKIRELNPCIRKITFSRYSGRRLPRNYELFIPEKIGTKQRLALKSNGIKIYDKN